MWYFFMIKEEEVVVMFTEVGLTVFDCLAICIHSFMQYILEVEPALFTYNVMFFYITRDLWIHVAKTAYGV